jgi:hypothetical protein
VLKAYLMTDMARRYFSGPELFRSQYAHPWLVWEPGKWKVGTPLDETLQSSTLEEEALSRGDALCFALAVRTGPLLLRVGRSVDNDVVVNDATVSREHIRLSRDSEGRWSVEAATDDTTTCRGEILKPGLSKGIVGGDQVVAGEVTLTFYDLVGFIERLGG